METKLEQKVSVRESFERDTRFEIDLKISDLLQNHAKNGSNLCRDVVSFYKAYVKSEADKKIFNAVLTTYIEHIPVLVIMGIDIETAKNAIYELEHTKVQETYVVEKPL